MRTAQPERRATHKPIGCRRRDGMILIELLAVLFLTAALTAVAVSSVFLLGPKLNRAAVGQLVRLGSLTDAAEQFRADVAGATTTSEQAGRYRAGDDTVILRIVGPGAEEGEGPTHLVWHWDGSELWRVRWDEKAPKYGRLGAEEGFGRVTFEVEPRDGNVRVAMQLEARREPGAGKLRARPARLEVVGVLGADCE